MAFPLARQEGALGPALVGDASTKVKQCRPRLEGPEIVKVPIKLWAMLDDPSSGRLQAAWPGVVEALQRHGELVLSKERQAKLLAISPATGDRLLREERRRLALQKPTQEQTGKAFPPPSAGANLGRGRAKQA